MGNIFSRSFLQIKKIKNCSSDFNVMFYPQTSVTSSTCETCFFVPQLRNVQKSMRHETKKSWLVEDPYHYTESKLVIYLRVLTPMKMDVSK